jgi:hypothetical protein
MKKREKPGYSPIHLSGGTTTPVLIIPETKRERERERMNMEKKMNNKHIE